jgi:hypothetical protein
MLVFFVDLSQARMKANVVLQPGFKCKAVVTLPKGPTCLVLAPEGSSFGPAIYVGINPGFERGPDVIYKITPDGTVSEFAKLPGESDPCDLEFPPAGSPYGDFLYVSANNLDRRYGGDYGGTILRISPDGKVEYFTPVGLQPEGKPLGLGEPAGIAFGPGGAFGTSLYVANSSDPPCDIARVDASGNVEVFMSDGETGYGYGMALGPSYLDFGPGKPFTSKLYFTDYPTSSVRSADSSGGFSPPWVRLPFLRKRIYPAALKFSPGGAFGKGLYVAMRHNIYRVYPDGKFTLFATGFEWLGGDCMQFSPSEDALFVVDNVDYSLFKITRADPAVAEDSIVIRGQVKDQYGEPAEGIQVCFMGQPWVGTDANGMYNLSYPLLADQKSAPLRALLADPEDPPRYQNELREVSLEEGENVLDFQFNRVPA